MTCNLGSNNQIKGKTNSYKDDKHYSGSGLLLNEYELKRKNFQCKGIR